MSLKTTWMPYFVFILSMGIISLLEMAPIHGDATQAWLPGGIYGDHWDSASFEPFSGSRLTAIYWVSLVVYNFGVSILGYLLLRPLYFGKDLSVGTKVGAGYAVGYLATIGINRLVTLFFPHSQAPKVCVVLLAMVTLLLFFQSVKGRSIQYLLNEWRNGSPFLGALELLKVAIVYLIFIVWHVQFGRNYLVPDSTTTFYLPFLRSTLASLSLDSYFPLVDQQYDEILFSYPLLYSEMGRAVSIVPFWILNAIGKASITFLLYILLKQEKSSVGQRVLYVAAALFLMLGTAVPNPTKYIELAGGNNPMIYGGHIGRLLGTILPWLLICYFFQEPQEDPASEGGDEYKFYRVKWAAAVFLGCGIAATSIHNFLFSFVTLLACRFYPLFRSQFSLTPKKAGMLRIAFVALIGCPLLNYMLGGAKTPFLGGVPLFFGVIVGAFALSRVVSIPLFSLKSLFVRTSPVPNARLMLVCILSSLVSIAFLGNVISPSTIAALNLTPLVEVLPPAYSAPLLRRGIVSLQQKVIPFRFVGVQTPSKHATSFWNFLGYYGLFFFVLVALYYLLSRHWNHQMGSKKPFFFEYFSIIFLICFSVALFYVDFVADGTQVPWVKYRLIEVPFFSLIILFYMVVDRASDERNRIAISAMSLAWTIVPFFVNFGLSQWALNFKYLVQQVAN